MAPIAFENVHGNGLIPTPKLAKEPQRLNIIDIRRDKNQLSLYDDIIKGLEAKEGTEKTLPTMLLYDKRGLQLFENITYLDEYYLTNAEIEVLESHAADIARHIRPGSLIVELGSGNLRKTCILLDALEKLETPCQFFALDLSLPELQRTISAVPAYEHIKVFGLHGTYDDGLEWLKRPEQHMKPKCIMSLGSSLGNFTRAGASSFLKGFANALVPERDVLLVGLDACQDPSRVYKAYNDERGTTRRFILNGLAYANRILGEDIFKPTEWEYVGEYDMLEKRHQAFYVPNRDIAYRNILIRSGERVRVEESYKYSLTQSAALWARSGLHERTRWGTKGPDSSHFIYLLASSHTGYRLY